MYPLLPLPTNSAYIVLVALETFPPVWYESTSALRVAEPVVVGTTLRVTELELKEPTGKQLATAEREPNQARIYITLASLCSGLPRAAIEKLPLPAFTEGVAYLRGFTTGARWTGRR